MLILLITVLVIAGFVIVDWVIYRSPIVDEGGHERAAEREGRWYRFNRERQSD